MGEVFKLKVYNYSPKKVEFEITNSGCMYLPANRTILVEPFAWGEFETMETSNAFFKGCRFAKSKFTIAAKVDGKALGNTTYRVYDSLKRVYFHVIDGWTAKFMAIDAKETFGESFDILVFERQQSYGDLFFNGRGIYVENNIKSKLRGTSAGAESSVEVDEMLPTSLINSNAQFVNNINDNDFSNVLGRWVNVGLEVADVYGFVKGRNFGAKAAASALEVGWANFRDTMKGYYPIYRSLVAAADETSVHAHKEDDPPSFHLVFTDTTAKADEIMLGNFYLPEPPNNSNTFYQNIMHLTKRAAEIRAKAPA